MSILAQNTKLNVTPGGIIPIVHVTQYDVNRELTFTLYDGNGAASIPSDTQILIEGTKPDGHGFQYLGSLSGNVVTVNTTMQMCACQGTTECKLKLTYGSQVIGTALFLLEVEKAGLQDSTDISDTDIPLIVALATEQMTRAEAAADSASTDALIAEGNAVGTQHGESVPDTSPYYHNNAKYYADRTEEIAENLPNALIPQGTCLFEDLPSIADSNIGDMWNISDNFTTTADFRGGAGVNVPAGSYVYLTDSNKWDVLAGDNTSMFIGSQAEWDLLTPTQKSQYTLVFINDDLEFTPPIDNALSLTSERAVMNKVITAKINGLSSVTLLGESSAAGGVALSESIQNYELIFIMIKPISGSFYGSVMVPSTVLENIGADSNQVIVGYVSSPLSISGVRYWFTNYTTIEVRAACYIYGINHL